MSVVAGVWFVMTGCATPSRMAPVLTPADSGTGADVATDLGAPVRYEDRAWADVLRENVVDGRVNYRHLRDHPEALESFLARVERVGPDSTPAQFASRVQRLAYYANVYNACALRTVLLENVPDSVYSIGRPTVERRYRFRVDNRWMTLADLRGAARAQAPTDVRVEFCLCEPALGGAPLPGQPIRAEGLDDQLDDIARRALASERVVRVDHAGQTLRVALFTWQRQADFVEFYRVRMQTSFGTLRNALNDLADAPTRERIARAVGYPVRPMPFDARLNQLTVQASP